MKYKKKYMSDSIIKGEIETKSGFSQQQQFTYPTLPTPGVPLSNGEFPGGKLGLNRILSDPGSSDADNGMPDVWTGSPPLHCLGNGSGVGKKYPTRFSISPKLSKRQN